jgi:hypothetical protein
VPTASPATPTIPAVVIKSDTIVAADVAAVSARSAIRAHTHRQTADDAIEFLLGLFQKLQEQTSKPVDTMATAAAEPAASYVSALRSMLVAFVLEHLHNERSPKFTPPVLTPAEIVLFGDETMQVSGVRAFACALCRRVRCRVARWAWVRWQAAVRTCSAHWLGEQVNVHVRRCV